MIHIWWTCSKLKSLGVNLHHEIVSMLNIPLELSPENCLLHLFTKLKKNHLRCLVNNLLVAAKMLIAKNWKSQTIPTIQETAD